MGFVIVIYACLTAQPTACEEYRLNSLAEGTCYAPAIQAGPIFQWMISHPERDLKTWKCFPHGRVEEET
jgi:hypothetical protein